MDPVAANHATIANYANNGGDNPGKPEHWPPVDQLLPRDEGPSFGTATEAALVDLTERGDRRVDEAVTIDLTRLDARLDQALNARTYADLEPLTADRAALGRTGSGTAADPHRTRTQRIRRAGAARPSCPAPGAPDGWSSPRTIRVVVRSNAARPLSAASIHAPPA